MSASNDGSLEMEKEKEKRENKGEKERRGQTEKEKERDRTMKNALLPISRLPSPCCPLMQLVWVQQ